MQPVRISSRPVRVVAWVTLALGMGYAIGFRHGANSGSSSAGQADARSTEIAGSGVREDVDLSSASRSLPPRSNWELDSLARLAREWEFIRSYDLTRLQSEFSRVAASPYTADRTRTLRLFLRRFGQIAPREGMAAARSLGLNEVIRGEAEVLKAWGEHDLAGPWEWLAEDRRSRERGMIDQQAQYGDLVEHLSELGRQSELAPWLLSLPDGPEKNFLAMKLAASWVLQDGDAAVAWTKTSSSRG